MVKRRGRLEFALNILPYAVQSVQLSAEQKQVEDILARLRTDDSSSEEDDSVDEKRVQRHSSPLNADAFAEETLRQIVKSENGAQFWEELQISPVQAEQAAEEFDNAKLIDEEAAWADVDRAQLLENSIQAVNEARIKLLQHWEITKRKALGLLTVEIDKVQSLDMKDDDDAEDEGTTARFDLFCDGTEKHNTSTPKTIEEDEEDEVTAEEDDDFEPGFENIKKGKRKRLQAPATSTPQSKRQSLEFEFNSDEDNMITLGPNGTKIAKQKLDHINWSTSGAAITRKLLCEIFDRDTLAFHTLSGKPSPAFKDCARPSKQQLDPNKVEDLVHMMTTRMGMTSREVRTAITTKCADENKMLRTRQQRQQRFKKKL